VYVYLSSGSPGAVTGTSISANYSVTAGQDYKVRVLGYNSASQLIAEGTSAATGVISSTTTNVSVTLKAIADSGTGKFSWDVTLPSNATTATMTLEALTGNASITGTPFDGVDLDLLDDSIDAGTQNNTNAGITLNAGYYRITVSFAKADFQTTSESVILHVYENYTTTYAPAAFAALTSKLYTVSFDKNYSGATNDIPDITSVAHGAMIAAAPSPAPTQLGNTFVNWYTNAAGTGSAWVFNASTGTPVYGTFTLFAKWTPSPNTINLSLIYQGVGQAAWTGLSASATTLDGSNLSATVSLDTTDAVYTDMVWRLGTVTLVTSESSGIVSATLNRDTLSASLANGTYKLIIDAKIDGIPHSSETTAPITVTIEWP